MTFYADYMNTHDSKMTEIARILREVAEKIENGRSYGGVFDGNGNTIGAFDINAKE